MAVIFSSTFLSSLILVCSNFVSSEAGLDVDFIPRVASGTLIHLNASKANAEFWNETLTGALKKYGSPPEKGKNNIVMCSYDLPPPNDRVCNIDIKTWGPCYDNYFSNYERYEPCVFLEISNRPIDFVPEYYNDPDDLPEEMPTFLKKKIRETNTDKRDNVWVSCSGSNPPDVEFLGQVKYFPENGFPSYYFPLNTSSIEEDLPPLVAVQFKRTNVGIVIFIECRLWAKNIKKEDPAGKIEFQLYLD